MEKTRDMSSDIGLHVSDPSGQRCVHVKSPGDATVGELLSSLLAEMNLPKNDPEKRPLIYHVRSEREGRHLHASERVGDALRPGDRITLQPNVDAG